MRLTEKVIEKMKSVEHRKIRNLLAYNLNSGEITVSRWIEANEENSMLTTVKALQIISQELNIPIEKLTVEKQTA